MDFTVLFTSEPEGGYTAEVVELPGCVSYGETIEEASMMIEDAARGYLISVKKHQPYQKIVKKHHFLSSLSLHEAV